MRTLLCSFFVGALIMSGSVSFASNQRATLSVEDLAALSPEQFQIGIEALKVAGYQEVAFEQQSPRALRTNANTPGSSGDFYIMMGLEKNDNDDKIRLINYFNFQNMIIEMSELRFRVIMNLYAGVADLKSALNASRPTVILWTSHGDPTNFFSATGEPVPPSVFKDATPYVYQFILAACWGKEAYSFKYQSSIPRTMRFFGWQGETRPSKIKEWLYSEKWSAFMHRPEISNEGLVCMRSSTSSYGFNLVVKSTQKKLPGMTFNGLGPCHEALLKASQGFACVQTGPIDYTTVSIPKLAITQGSKYSSLEECTNRLKSAYNKKLCRGMPGSNKVWMIDSRTNTANERYYTSMPQCVNDLIAEREL